MKAVLSEKIKFFSAVGIQLIIILIIILTKLTVSAGGTEVLLKIQPVDPRDLLRGDYATFSYSISRIHPGLFRPDNVQNGDTVYVILRRSGRLWDAREVLHEQPDSTEIFLKGKVVWRGYQNRLIPDHPIHIIFGIEEYFIPEGAGGGLARWSRDDTAVAKVAVDVNGNAVLKEIMVNWKTWP